MPLVEELPVGIDCAQWTVWGTTARIVVTRPEALPAAEELVRAELAAVDAACSRFRPDAELMRARGRTVTVSPLLADLVGTALRAARETDGDVDPTVGAALCGLGYDRDFGAVVDPGFVVYAAADWRRVTLDGDRLSVPAGTLLDLGATAKARAADRAAATVADRLGVGVLVALGGDIATAGPATPWKIRVQDGPDEPRQTLALPAGAALATSSTISRRWHTAGELVHHIVDPRTGRPARRVWRTASVVAFSCVRANTLATAAIVRGTTAPAWLGRLGAPARLVDAAGTVTTLNGWAR